MVTIVFVINTSIALMLLLVAVLLWQLKLRLVKITNWLVFIDRQTNALLEQAPEKIYLSQQNLSHLKHKKQVLALQIQKLQQTLYLILWAQQIWRRFNPHSLKK